MPYTTPPDISNAVKAYLTRSAISHFEAKAALIDMDGTLYDSMGGHADAWHRLMTEEGIPTSRDEFFLYEGRTGASTINLLFRRHHGREATADEIERLYHRKTVYFTQLPPVKPMPGALSVMGQIAAKGLRRVLVTGSGQSSLIDRLDHDFPGIFAPTDRITSRDVSHGKPHPEPYIKAMALAGALPTESIVLENAPLGVESGHASGAFTIAVTTGPIPAADMRQAGADIVFESMELLATTLPQLFETFNKTHI